ncbi:MAG: FKBP-type peptidyl-prolyl cis-trans isomerase [Fimbriimonadaceae bacterium]|nr:FKBP-type peptidyl-prolyl cis-trans isomerase [Fimbriimonadaceae bacterium]
MIASTLIAGIFLLTQAPKTEVVDLSVGKGNTAAYGDIVTMNVQLKDGKGNLLLSSDKAPPTAWHLGMRDEEGGNTFLPLGEFDKAIKGMMVGGKRKITIPPELGFGELTVGRIQPNSTLIFEVELFDIRKKDSEPLLKIVDTKEGTGDSVVQGDLVEVHYRGKFLNGVQFDSSYERMESDGKVVARPLEVTVGVTRLIKGFTDGLMGLKVGGRRTLTIPYEMGYGPQGRGGAIPPFATLVFELELVSIKKGN